MAAHEIKSALPHRYPMLLVDRVADDASDGCLTAIKAVTCNEPWYLGLPDELDETGYDYPAVLVLESWCQAAGLLAAADRRQQPAGGAAGDLVPLFGGVSDVRFSGRVRPGDVLNHRVRQLRATAATAIFEGECLVDGRVVMSVGRLIVASRPPEVVRKQAAAAGAGADG